MYNKYLKKSVNIFYIFILIFCSFEFLLYSVFFDNRKEKERETI